MKSNKYLYWFFLSILILFVFISSSSATDNTTDLLSIDESASMVDNNMNILSVDNNVKSNELDNDTLKVSNDELLTSENKWYVNESKTSSGDGRSKVSAFKTLIESLTLAQDGDTIMIASGKYTGNDNLNLTINKKLNFIKYGDGEAVFDAEGLSRIWTVGATSTNITGLTFKNGKALDGGAVYCSGFLNVDECIFINNTAKKGGAIYWNGAKGIISDCNFTGNIATEYYGGAIYWNGTNGIISDCNFTGNVAWSYGGAIYWLGTNGIISDCNFINNTAAFYYLIFAGGGAISWIHGVNGTISNCNFTNNIVNGNGGAIRWRGVNGTVFNCNFINNTQKGAGGDGGAIDCLGDNCIISDCNFTANTAISGGAIFLSSGDNGGVFDCNFTGNVAWSYGGAIYLYNVVNGSVFDCNFINNTANNDGGAIFWQLGDNATVSDCNFTGNTAISGGVIALGWMANAIVSDCNFMNNTASNDGCTISCWCGANVTISDCNFTNNAALYIIKFNGSTATDIGANTFDGNNIVDGNLIDVEDSKDTIVKKNIIENNTLSSRGEIIKVENSTGSDISNNTYVANVPSINVDDVVIDDDLVINLPKDATGIFTVNIGGETITIPVVNGTAVISKEFLPAGNYNATLTYSGDDKYKNASTIVVIVNPKLKENLTIVASAKPIAVGENATVVVDGLVNATGNVSVIINGKTYTALINKGEAIVIVSDLTESVTASVNYGGDKTYNSASTTVTIVVNPKTDIIIVAGNVTKYYHGSERFVVTVSNASGVPIAGKSVTITINGVSYTRGTDDSGATSISLNLNSGEYSVTVVVDKITVKAVVTILSTVNGTDVVKMYRNATHYLATFRDSTGKYLAGGTTVNFNINGIMYARTIDANGLAKLNINLPQGSYIITATNPVTGEAGANNITVIPLIVENNDLVKYYKNASQFVVKVIDSTGKSATGVTVTYNVNGVFYYRTTDVNGYAQLNINLPPNDYVITSEYGGCRVANNIKVSPVLTASDMAKKYGSSDQFVATLVDGQGRPYAGQSVSFNINGVMYNRLSDSEGKVRLNINLPAGEYIITSSYNGSNIANKITIIS